MCSINIFLWDIKLQKQDQIVKLTESPCKSHDGIQAHSLDPTSELIIIKTRELFNCKHCLSLHLFYYIYEFIFTNHFVKLLVAYLQSLSLSAIALFYMLLTFSIIICFVSMVPRSLLSCVPNFLTLYNPQYHQHDRNLFLIEEFYLHRAAPLEKNSANIFPMTILKLLDSGVMHTRL